MTSRWLASLWTKVMNCMQEWTLLILRVLGVVDICMSYASYIKVWVAECVEPTTPVWVHCSQCVTGHRGLQCKTVTIP